MDAPMPLVILHLKIKMEKNTKQSIRNNKEMEQTIPSEETGTGSWNAMLYMNHGSGKLNHWGKLIIVCTIRLLEIMAQDFCNVWIDFALVLSTGSINAISCYRNHFWF